MEISYMRLRLNRNQLPSALKRVVLYLLFLALAIAVPIFLSNKIFDADEQSRTAAGAPVPAEEFTPPPSQDLAAPFIIFNADGNPSNEVSPARP